MGSVSTFLNLALGQEDTFGKVLGGSTGKGARTMWREAKASSTGLPETFSNFVNLSKENVEKFDKNMNLAQDLFDKKTLKALRKSGKTNKEFYNKLIDLCDSNGGKLSKENVLKFLKENKISQVKESRGFFGTLKGIVTGNKAEMRSIDKIAESVAAKSAAKSAETTAEKSIIKGGSKLFKSLKGKGGTLGIILSVGLEGIDIFKAYKNGDCAKQVGRSAINLGGFAAGAAAGAAIGSIIPVAGTAVGGIVGGICGFVGGALGGSAASWIGKKIFGESIADQKEEAQEQQEKLAEEQQQNAQQYAQFDPNLIQPDMYNLNTCG